MATLLDKTGIIARGAARCMPVILVLSAFALLTSKSLYNYPVSLMAMLGLLYCLRRPRAIFRHSYIRIYCVLFLCIWLPMLLALPDAANFDHSLDTVAPFLRFLFMGVYLVYALNTPALQRAVLLGLFCLVAFWCIDAVAQVLFKMNFFGYPYEERHITGMFYPKNTIAHICAGLSPLYFDLIRQYYREHRQALLLLLPLFIVILLSGRRAAWVMLAVSSLGYITCTLALKTRYRVRRGHAALLALLLGLAMAAIVATHDTTQRRIKTTLGMFSSDYEEVNRATARRLPLWHTSVKIAGEHWLNGIGPRGYRHVYSSFADENDAWKSSGQTHPHQLLLEVLTETGLLGLIGLACFGFFFYRGLRGCTTAPPVFPWVLAVIVVVFPFNTHMAFYGSYWSSFFWLLLALAMSARCNHEQAKAAPGQSP